MKSHHLDIKKLHAARELHFEIAGLDKYWQDE